MKKFYAYLHNENGATAIEYGLIATFISLALIGVILLFGNNLNNLYALLPDVFG